MGIAGGIQEIAREILKRFQRKGLAILVFPHRNRIGEGLSSGTLNALMTRLGWKRPTVHGFRSVFSTRYNSLSAANADVVERCLAHAPKDQVRAVYNRHDYADERRAMLQDWADYIDALLGENVVKLAAA